MSCHIPYLSKHTSYDCTFCCTSLKWWHLQMLFSFFPNFSFLGSKGAVEEVQRAKNGPKWQKILSSYLRNCTTYDYGFWYTCVKWWYFQQFFSFFEKSVLFGFLKGVVCPTFFPCAWFFLKKINFKPQQLVFLVVRY